MERQDSLRQSKSLDFGWQRLDRKNAYVLCFVLYVLCSTDIKQRRIQLTVTQVHPCYLMFGFPSLYFKMLYAYNGTEIVLVCDKNEIKLEEDTFEKYFML